MAYLGIVVYDVCSSISYTQEKNNDNRRIVDQKETKQNAAKCEQLGNLGMGDGIFLLFLQLS